MSQLISSWLNTCGLSVTVLPSTLEAQFANGYRIGELLSTAYHARRLKLMDESDFSRFADCADSAHGARSTAINNFLLLQPILRGMQIALPVDQVRRIVIQERGAALDLLFKIRLALSRHDGKFPVVKVRKFEASVFNIHRDEKPPQPMWTRATEIYDTIVNPKKTAAERDMGIHLHHFEESQNAWEERCAQMDVDEILEQKANAKARKAVETQRLREKAEFSAKWEADQVTRWAETQQRQIRKERHDLSYELSAVEKARRKGAVKTRRAEIELDQGINWFERNRKRLGVGGGDDDDEDSAAPAGAGGGADGGAGRTRGVDRVTPLEHLARIEESTTPQLKNLAVPARNYMKRLHERAEEEKQNRKDRGARRRKQALDQRNAQHDAEKGKHKVALLKSVIVTSKSERDAARAKWEARHRAGLLEEDKNAARVAEDMKRASMLNAYFHDLTTTARQAAAGRADEEQTMRTSMRANLVERQRVKHAERSKWIGDGITSTLVELALLVVTRKAEEASLGRDALIPRKEWRIMRTGMVKGFDPLEYKHWRASLGGGTGVVDGRGSTSSVGEGADSEAAASVEPLVNIQLDLAERNDFNARRGSWAPSAEAVAVAAVDSGDSTSAEETSVYMEQIGRMLRGLCDPLPGPPPAPLSADNPLVGIALLGAPSLLKSSASALAQSLAERRRLRVVSEADTLDMARAVAEGTLSEDHSQFWSDECKEALATLGAEVQAAESEEPSRSPEPSVVAKALVAQVKDIANLPTGSTGGWLLLGWPATKEQAMMLEFELEGPMTGGATYEKASGPKSKWKPPAAEEAQSVIKCVVELVPAPTALPLATEEGEVESGSSSPEEKEAAGEEGDVAAEEKEMDEAMIKADEVWTEARAELLDAWFVDRCQFAALNVMASASVPEVAYPSLDLLRLDDMFLEASASLKAAAAVAEDGTDGDADGGEEGKGDDASGGAVATGVSGEAATNASSRLGASPLLTMEDCCRIQQDQIEAAVRRGEDPALSGALSIVDVKVVQSLLHQWSSSEAVFNESVLPVFRTLRVSTESFMRKWSEARSVGMGRLGDASNSEEIIHGFNRRLREIAALRPIPIEQTKKLKKQLNEEVDEVIDRLYSATSEKQREAEHLHSSLVHSDWNAKHLSTVDRSLKVLVDAYVHRINSVSDVISQYFKDVEVAFREGINERPKINDSSSANPGDTGGVGTMLDASPSALPEFAMDSGEPAVSAAGEDRPDGKLPRGRDDDTIDNLRPALPEFVASCMTALQTFEERSTSHASTVSVQQPELCVRIVKQLWKSVDEFIAAIVEQAETRISISEDTSRSSISELDEWIGNIVAAETASVGAMRKSMLTAISSVFDNDVDEDSSAMQIAMRYAVTVKDDGPSLNVFDTRCKDSTLRAPRNFRLSTGNLRVAIQSLRAAAMDALSSQDRKSGKGLDRVPQAMFVDVLYRLASAGQLVETWSSLSRSKFAQLAQLYDPTGSGLVAWRDFCLGQIFAHLPKKGGLPNVASLRKMYSSFVRADDMSPTQSSADVVEWNEFCSVHLWFESGGVVSEELAWQLRELVWLIFSENASAESRGQLAYPDFVMSLAQDPRAGKGAMRAVGIFKAWHIQCFISQCRGGRMEQADLRGFLSCAASSPKLPTSVVDIVASKLYEENHAANEELAVSFEDLALVIDECADEIPVVPFIMKDPFELLRGVA